MSINQCAEAKQPLIQWTDPNWNGDRSRMDYCLVPRTNLENWKKRIRNQNSSYLMAKLKENNGKYLAWIHAFCSRFRSELPSWNLYRNISTEVGKNRPTVNKITTWKRLFNGNSRFGRGERLVPTDVRTPWWKEQSWPMFIPRIELRPSSP